MKYFIILESDGNVNFVYISYTYLYMRKKRKDKIIVSLTMNDINDSNEFLVVLEIKNAWGLNSWIYWMNQNLILRTWTEGNLLFDAFSSCLQVYE